MPCVCGYNPVSKVARLGEHSAELLAEAGYSDAEIAAFLAKHKESP